jgi:hypothetical protein
MGKERLVCWFSCGAASAVATKLVLHENPVIVYTQVKEEHTDNQRFLEDCERWFDKEIIILKDDYYDGSIFNVFETNYMRTPAGSPCTRNLKKRVREKFQQPNDIQVFGYTVDEQSRVDRFIDANNIHLRTPLIENHLTKGNCLAILKKVGIELPAMYKLGYNNNNCIGCVKGGMGYWNKIRIDFPDHFERMAELEKRKGYTCLKDKNGPVYLHNLDKNRGNYPKEPQIECGIFCEAVT